MDTIMIKRQRTKGRLDIPEHLISIKSLERSFIDSLMQDAEKMRTLVISEGGDDRLKHRILGCLFYEPSTRTSSSFQAAMQRLGGNVINVLAQGSSIQKGESLEDTVRSMCCYCDVVAIRHPEEGSAQRAADVANKPIINAGDGVGEHPTQALLDLFTIHSELGYIGSAADGNEAGNVLMTITFVGDLKHGRTVHSLVRLLSRFPGMRFVYVSPPSLALPADLIQEVTEADPRIEQVAVESLDEVIAAADVLYVTRIQKERFASEEEYNGVCNSYCIDKQMMSKAKKNMVLMHPLPRLGEICAEVDSDPRSAYFRQMECGMYMRMALLNLMLLENN